LDREIPDPAYTHWQPSDTQEQQAGPARAWVIVTDHRTGTRRRECSAAVTLGLTRRHASDETTRPKTTAPPWSSAAEPKGGAVDDELQEAVTAGGFGSP